jgi:hypothetical protein
LNKKKHDDIADPEQNVHRAGKKPGSESIIEKGDRSAFVGKCYRQARVRIGRHQCDQPRDQKSDRRRSAGQLDREAKDRENSTPHHSSHTDGDNTPVSHFLPSRRHIDSFNFSFLVSVLEAASV